MKRNNEPDLKLFNQFVTAASPTLLIKLRELINKQITKTLTNETRWNYVKGDKYCLKDKQIDNPKAGLAILLEEDWSYLFGDYDDTGNDCYVYFHSDPRSPVSKYRYDDVLIEFKSPFYVGMGRGDRIYSLSRSLMHLSHLNELLEDGYTKPEIMTFFKQGLSERSARELEAKMILFFGIKTAIPEKKQKKGTIAMSGRKFSLYNHKYEPFNEIYTRYAFNGFIKNISLWSESIK